MDITRIDPGDAASVRGALAVRNAAQAVDAPEMLPSTEVNYGGWLRYGWDGDPPYAWLARVDDEPVGVVQIEASTYDNTHLAWLDIVVHPDHRRRGHGSALFDFGLDHARRELGRTTIGLEGWDDDHSRRFADQRGFEAKYTEAIRRQTLADVDHRAVAAFRTEAQQAAGDYEMVRIPGRTPDELLGDMADLVAAINDAPRSGLDLDDEVYTPDRIRGYDAACVSRGLRVYRVVARHRSSGELAGNTAVVVEVDRPAVGGQHDTSVLAAHRGHRLGLLLKADMMEWLAQAEPQLETIDTGNEENNSFMVGVNEKLGYRLVARRLLFQRTFPDTPR